MPVKPPDRSDKITRLKAGETIQFRPVGNSMSGRIESGQLVTIEPVPEWQPITKRDVVFCKVKGRVLLHLVTATRNGRYQIGNNKGHINGWIGRDQIYGICTKVED